MGSIAFFPFQAFAQASGSTSVTQSTHEPGPPHALATPAGHEVSFDVAGYEYVEPGDTNISIHGPKLGGGYTGTMSLNSSQRWFFQANARGLFGSTTYDGWCLPWLITPDRTSPNGWALDLGDPSRCSESGDQDWYVESRAMVGKDFIGRTWGWSPKIGVGIRHLSNGTTRNPGHRTQDYLYLPVGMTARAVVGSHHALSFSLEYDELLHGWQTTRDSQFDGEDVPATPIAPAFTIEGFSDKSFEQHSGWALRASAKYQVTRRWSVEPQFIRWNVNASTVNYETTTFTVNGITARQQFGWYEPLNRTNEFVVKVGFRF